MPELVGPVLAAGSLGSAEQPSLTVDELVLRPWALTDAPALVRAYRDPGIQRWHARWLDSLAEAEELIAGWRDTWPGERECHWAVAELGTGALLGRMALKQLDLVDGDAALAYWTAPDARGRGVCTRAVGALTAWAFGAGFHRLHLEHSVANPASCRVATKAGFAPEGVRRQAARHADGWHDMHVHSRLATD